jgi:hypothetical protein
MDTPKSLGSWHLLNVKSHVLGSSLIKRRDQMSPLYNVFREHQVCVREFQLWGHWACGGEFQLYNVFREQKVKFLARVWKMETSWALKGVPKMW